MKTFYNKLCLKYIFLLLLSFFFFKFIFSLFAGSVVYSPQKGFVPISGPKHQSVQSVIMSQYLKNIRRNQCSASNDDDALTFRASANEGEMGKVARVQHIKIKRDKVGFKIVIVISVITRNCK